MILKFLLVFVGGGVGSVIRYIFSKTIPPHIFGFINSTLFVNILGSFIIGCIFSFFIKNQADISNSNIYILAVIGFLGGFTTFSTFSLDVLHFINNGQVLQAAFYILLSVMVSLLAVYTGYIIFK
ncbi:MAG TPA: fluoride efflux transporter CrcB [Alphaproteobacteria bacterium]|nr:fluoride efflux transporter CrcB [Alphaproteobacteria bacterium]